MIYPKEYGTDTLYPQATDFSVEFKNYLTGSGVVCLKPFNKGQTMAKLAGDVVNSIREHTIQIKPNEYLNDVYFGGYFLHSCDPNAALDMQSLLVVAIKNIEIGSYITIDYTQSEDYLFRQFKCGCGYKKCRGVIAGKKETPRTSLSLIEHYEDDSDNSY